MSEEGIKGTLDRVESLAGGYHASTGESVVNLAGGVEALVSSYKEDISATLTRSETALARQTALLYDEAGFHLLRAYFHASPSLISIILAIYGFIKMVVTIINVINDVFKVITGETLAYWLDQIMPGFQAAWNDMMNKVSSVSSALGWGVDGVLHLMNIVDAGSHAVGAITGKDPAWVKMDKYKNTHALLDNLSKGLDQWQKNPGQMINSWATTLPEHASREGSEFMAGLHNMARTTSDKLNEFLLYSGRVTNEFNALFMDMPTFIANHIPQNIRDGVAWADTMINDRLLPTLDKFQRRLDEVDILIDKYKSDMQALAGKISKPGDLLAEIDALPDYIRKDQEDKISDISSRTLKRTNETDMAANESRLREFDKVYDAMVARTPAPEFLTLESPARAALTGIVAEPRETWLVGDY